MRVFKKLLCVGFIVAALVVSFSLSASAIDSSEIVYDGVSADGVVHFNVDISDFQPYCYATAFHVQQTDDWYLAVFYFNSFSSGVNPENIDVSLGRYNYDDRLVLGFNNPISSTPVNGAFCNLYNQDGSIWTETGYNPRYLGWCGVGDFLSNNNFSGRQPANVDYIQPIFNTCFYNDNYYSCSINLTSYSGDFYLSSYKYRAIPITGFQGFYYETADGLTNFSGSEEIKNAIVGSGLIEPVFDSNGNITNYTYNVNFDLGLNDSPVPDPWGSDFPDPEQDLLDQLPGINSSDVSSINSNLSSNSLNSSSIQWLYARFDDVTSNNKFRAVMLTMLSISVIAFTLNKRGVL